MYSWLLKKLDVSEMLCDLAVHLVDKGTVIFAYIYNISEFFRAVAVWMR